MSKPKRQAQSRKRIIGGTELRRAFIPTPGDTFIFSERMVVDVILDGQVWLRHRKYDGSIDHISVPLNQWEKCAQNTLENGAIFRPVL
ncbi:MAG TPA: hypothetical protein VG077_01090 [Verrucomicrobiae bacterium]|nr:hypothetical protein [Verrucomicrobiae bacterium]HEV2434569.1 hypothetical protein [Verrucomicrobiae bacterium]